MFITLEYSQLSHPDYVIHLVPNAVSMGQTFHFSEWGQNLCYMETSSRLSAVFTKVKIDLKNISAFEIGLIKLS